MRLLCALAALAGVAHAADAKPAAASKPFWDPAFAPMVSPMFWDHSKARAAATCPLPLGGQPSGAPRPGED